MNTARILPRILLAGALLAAIAWTVSHRHEFDINAVSTAIRDLGVWAPLAYMGFFVAGTVLFLP
ncbi:MAG TPA: hypothetical protein VET85_15150, partial [Stellaceae bacterium]|nr:hypothetical protein [Stellaceae bacterium]